MMLQKNMNTYSLRSSLEEKARKKNPTLDIAAPKRRIPISRGEQAFFVTPRPFSPAVLDRKIDGINAHNQNALFSQKGQWLRIARESLRRGQIFLRELKRLGAQLLPSFGPHKMLYASLVGGIAFGMVSMAFIEHAFGPGVFARGEAQVLSVTSEEVKAPESTTSQGEYIPNQDVFFEYFGQMAKEQYEANIRDMVKGYPIEAMLPYIFEQDRMTAAFLIGIAKKESNWGKRIPVLESQDCFNYWGYRGIRRMMGSGGHTCFNSRKDAVETVATRLEKLIHSEKLDTPEKMIVWKCGFSCQGHSRESVKKWIADVDMYFSQLQEE